MKKMRKNRGKKGKKDEAADAGAGDLVMPGDPATGTPTVVMKGWGAIEALIKKGSK